MAGSIVRAWLLQTKNAGWLVFLCAVEIVAGVLAMIWNGLTMAFVGSAARKVAGAAAGG